MQYVYKNTVYKTTFSLKLAYLAKSSLSLLKRSYRFASWLGHLYIAINNIRCQITVASKNPARNGLSDYRFMSLPALGHIGAIRFFRLRL